LKGRSERGVGSRIKYTRRDGEVTVAEPFKNFINGETVRVAAAHLARHDARLDATRFCDEVIPQLDALELKARAMCVASALERHLAADFFAAADHLERALAPVPVHGTGIVVRSDEGLTGWFLWAAGEYVARRGLVHPERALECLRQLTQRFSAEFAIRPFLLAHEALVFDTLCRRRCHCWPRCSTTRASTYGAASRTTSTTSPAIIRNWSPIGWTSTCRARQWRGRSC
jgi:hypothetical protein